MMKIGIDAQTVADGNRSGLYSHLRYLVGALRNRPEHQVCVLALDRRGKYPSASTLGATFDGADVAMVHPPQRFYRLWHWLSRCNRVDVLVHMLHGCLPLTTRGANVYIVPDVIPLAFDYGQSGFADSYRPYYEAAVSFGYGVIVSSEHTKQDVLTRVGGDPNRFHVCPLAAGPEFIPPTDPAVIQAALGPLGLAGQRYVLCVATIEKRKNHAVLLRAFDRLIRHDPSIPHKLVLVGGKWIGHEAVFELAEQLGLGDRLVYLGYANPLPLIYAGADAFVFPSLYEGFGLPPLEAMACGVPTLAANASSLPEVVGDAGILFDPHDDAFLADSLRRVLNDTAYRDNLSRRAIQRAARFTWARTADAYLEAFKAGYKQFQHRATGGIVA